MDDEEAIKIKMNLKNLYFFFVFAEELSSSYKEFSKLSLMNILHVSRVNVYTKRILTDLLLAHQKRKNTL